MYNVYEVENPIYQEYEDIKKQYDENLIVISDTIWGKYSSLKGGVVRYYGNDRKKLINIWADMAHSDKYGKCVFKTLMSDYGVHAHD